MTVAPSVAVGYDLWAPTYDSEPNILIALDESDQLHGKRLDAIRRARVGLCSTWDAAPADTCHC